MARYELSVIRLRPLNPTYGVIDGLTGEVLWKGGEKALPKLRANMAAIEKINEAATRNGRAPYIKPERRTP